MKDFLHLAATFRNTPIIDDEFPHLRTKFDTQLFNFLNTLPKIVCLCGSTRFYEQFQKANYEETMVGNIVLSVGFYPHSSELAHGQKTGCSDVQKTALDELHKRKIDLADEIFVLNVGGYIGESTRSEIQYAESLAKQIRYLEPIKCEWCAAGDKPNVLDADGVKSSISGEPGVLSHAYEDCWWECPNTEKEVKANVNS